MAETVLIVDDHPMFATALTYACQAVDPGMTVVTAKTLAEAEARLEEEAFSLILLDLVLPDVAGMTGLALIRAIAPAAAVVLVTGKDDAETIAAARALGVRGFLSKAMPLGEMVEAIRRILAGATILPPSAPSREAETADRLSELSLAQIKVLRAIASGRQNKQIAYDLGLAEPTIKSHLAAIFRKLRVTNRTQAVLLLGQFDARTESLDVRSA
jgi:DNA-binding NarL/FixJ family response regulator